MQTASPRRPGLAIVLVTALVPLAFDVGGVILLLISGPLWWEGIAARSWPETTGRVVEVRVEETDLGGQGPGTKRWFEVHLIYDFVVEGRTYRSDRNALWRDRVLAPRAKEMRESYPAGRQLPVFYDPTNPAHCLLDRSIGGGTIAMAIGGIVTLALGILMSIGFVRAVRRGV